jgi:N-acetyl-gamma-glutamyl-phosphate reductase
MRQELGLSGDAPFVFVPHLLPTVRGILSTLYVSFAEAQSEGSLAAAFAGAYAAAPFVKVRPAGELPELRDVVGTPRAEIGFALLPGGRRAVLVSVLDNLLKGAASQAVQNMNRVFGHAATEGLS